MLKRKYSSEDELSDRFSPYRESEHDGIISPHSAFFSPKSATTRSMSQTPTFTMLRSAVLPVLLAVATVGLFSDYIASPAAISYGDNATAAGTVLATTDSPVQSQDYMLDFPISLKQTELLVWDFADEDGDAIQVKADGHPITEPFTLFHAPRTIHVPVGSAIEVVGIRDGGGGITYAVNFPSIKTSIRNGVETGKGNRYTLKHTESGRS